MKKIIVFIFPLLLSIGSNAQDIGNGDLTNGGNDGNNGGCPTFDVSCPNWFRAGGSPHCVTSSVIHMYHEAAPTLGGGEYILGTYFFEAFKGYCITVTLASFDMPPTSTFNLVTGSGSFTINSNCYDPVPSFSSQQVIGVKTDVTIGLTNTFIFQPTTSGFGLLIYPLITGPGRAKVEIDKVEIQRYCPDEKTFNNGLIPAQVWESNHFFVGTSYGGSVLVVNDPNLQTRLKAERSINIHEDFLATANEGYFIAEIAHVCECRPFVKPNPNSKSVEDSDVSDMWKNINFIYNDGTPAPVPTSQKVNVYPNPNNGSFTIRTNVSSNYLIKVLNMLGEVVYEEMVKDQPQKDIVLGSGLPPGNYTIHINGPDIAHVEKLTIIK
jgi:hypothetical protein